MWLINYQTSEGSFSETEYYPNPLHKPMEDYINPLHDSRSKGDYKTMRNISLTAHVLISLEKTAPNIQGELQSYSARARQRAVSYLERNIDKIEVTHIMLLKYKSRTKVISFNIFSNIHIFY